MPMTVGDILTHKTTELQQRAIWRDLADQHEADFLEYRQWCREYVWLTASDFTRRDVIERAAVSYDLMRLADRKADGAWWL